MDQLDDDELDDSERAMNRGYGALQTVAAVMTVLGAVVLIGAAIAAFGLASHRDADGAHDLVYAAVGTGAAGVIYALLFFGLSELIILFIGLAQNGQRTADAVERLVKAAENR